MPPPRHAVALALTCALAACKAPAPPAGPGAQTLDDATRRAADAGDHRAQTTVGAYYCCDTAAGPPRDPALATTYLCPAARDNYAPAQVLLGRLYGGLIPGTPKDDPPVAVMWLTLAENGHDPDAAPALAALNTSVSSMDRDAGQRMVADWRDVPCAWHDVFPQ